MSILAGDIHTSEMSMSRASRARRLEPDRPPASKRTETQRVPRFPSASHDHPHRTTGPEALLSHLRFKGATLSTVRSRPVKGQKRMLADTLRRAWGLEIAWNLNRRH